MDGAADGSDVGMAEGRCDGFTVGFSDGSAVGSIVGIGVGFIVGMGTGAIDGLRVATMMIGGSTSTMLGYMGTHARLGERSSSSESSSNSQTNPKCAREFEMMAATSTPVLSGGTIATT